MVLENAYVTMKYLSIVRFLVPVFEHTAFEERCIAENGSSPQALFYLLSFWIALGGTLIILRYK